MQFDFIAIRDGKVKLRYTTHPGGDEATVGKHSLSSKEEPEKEFNDALKALVPHVIHICEFQKEDAEKIEVTGVRLSWRDDRMGAMITAKKKLDAANSPLNIATPLLFEQDLDEEAAHLPQGAVEAIDRLREMAERFINGHRSQGDLFDREDAQTPAGVS